jgi:Calcineurin-like phosphoesterase
MSSAREDAGVLTRLRSNSRAYPDLPEYTENPENSMDEQESFPRDFNRRWNGSASSYPQYPPRKPLIEQCTNEWQHSNKWKSRNTSPDAFEDALESFFDRCLAILKAPKIRRYLLLYTFIFGLSILLWSSTIWPAWQEQRILSQSLSAQNRRLSGGVFGSNLRPSFPNMIQVKDMDPKYIPRPTAPKHPSSDNVNRLIFVGDVHGCLDELKALLDKVNFNTKRDHLITTGDLIAKGPHSTGTVDFVRQMRASCVRGNHEDRILLMASALNSTLLHHENPGEPSSVPESPDRALAASLSAEQISYLESCPVILRVGFMRHLAGDLVVVHAGLVPGVSLERQDPSAVMSMRSIDLATHVPSKHSRSEGGVHWIKLWNKYQQSLPTRWSFFFFSSSSSTTTDPDAQRTSERHTTVIYGHDAKKGLQLHPYSKGIDTGCVRGGKLTALILSDGGRTQTVQVQCRDYRKQRPLDVQVEQILQDGTPGRQEDRFEE